MAVFMLYTDEVSNVASSITSLSNDLTNLASTVNGYDVSGAEEFDFATPRSVIASNIEACATKVANTSTVMNEVVNTHTALQNKLVFDKQDNTGTNKTPVDTSKTPSTSPNNNNNNVNSTSPKTTTPNQNGNQNQQQQEATNSGGGGTSGGGGSSGGGGTGGGAAGAAGAAAAAATEPETTAETTPESTPSTAPLIDLNVDTIDASKLNISDSGSEIFDSDLFKYDENGFATIDGKYVISAGSDIGGVGDDVEITLQDGSVVKCVIGHNTNKENTVNFITNSKYNSSTSDNINSKVKGNITKVENCGHKNMYTTDNVIDNTLSAAIQHAASNENGDYSFIIKAYEDAGLNFGKIDKSNIVGTFENAGFKYFEGQPNNAALLPGDVLITPENQMVIYYGDNHILPDNNIYNPDGTLTPKEIDMTQVKWAGVLRYIGVTYKPTTSSSSSKGSNSSSGSSSSHAQNGLSEVGVA